LTFDWRSFFCLIVPFFRSLSFFFAFRKLISKKNEKRQEEKKKKKRGWWWWRDRDNNNNDNDNNRRSLLSKKETNKKKKKKKKNYIRAFVHKKHRSRMRPMLDTGKTNVTNWNAKKEREREGGRRLCAVKAKRKQALSIIIINDYCIRFNNGPLDAASLHFLAFLLLLFSLLPSLSLVSSRFLLVSRWKSTYYVVFLESNDTK